MHLWGIRVLRAASCLFALPKTGHALPGAEGGVGGARRVLHRLNCMSNYNIIMYVIIKLSNIMFISRY